MNLAFLFWIMNECKLFSYTVIMYIILKWPPVALKSASIDLEFFKKQFKGH